jgi:hypothetical protein
MKTFNQYESPSPIPAELVLAMSLSLATMASAPRAHAQGGVPLWTNRFSPSFVNIPAALKVDSNGNVLLAGTAIGSYGAPMGAVTIKYSNEGLPLWTNRFRSYIIEGDGPGGYTVARGMAVDPDGGVYVTAYVLDSFFEVGLSATMAYSSAGSRLWGFFGIRCALAEAPSGWWFNHPDPASIAVNSNDRVFVAGDADTNANCGLLWGGLAVAVDGGGNVIVTGDLGTTKCSREGVRLWTRNDVAGVNLAIDNSDNVFVRGYLTNGYSIATVKYSRDGVPLWINTDDSGEAIAVDRTGNVTVTGRSGTIRCSSGGIPLWTNSIAGTAVAADEIGNVFVGARACLDKNDCYATFAYSCSGVPLWTNRNDLSLDLVEPLMAVDRSGNVFVAGGTLNTNGVGGLVACETIKYSSSVPTNHAPQIVANVSPLFAVSPNETNQFILAPDNTDAAVRLDSSRSSGTSCDALQFFWFADNQTDFLATGAVATNQFVVGPHTVTLVVSDGQDTATAEVNFEVIAPATAVGQIVQLVEATDFKHQQPLLAGLEAARAAFHRGNTTAALNDLSALQNKIHVQVAPSNPTLASGLTAAVQQIIAAFRQ